MTIFLVEQNANHALRLSDRAYVMVNGVIRLTGTGKELLPQRSAKCLLMPAQISVTHLLVTQQLLAGAGQADYTIDHNVGSI